MSLDSALNCFSSGRNAEFSFVNRALQMSPNAGQEPKRNQKIQRSILVSTNSVNTIPSASRRPHASITVHGLISWFIFRGMNTIDHNNDPKLFDDFKFYGDFRENSNTRRFVMDTFFIKRCPSAVAQNGSDQASRGVPKQVQIPELQRRMSNLPRICQIGSLLRTIMLSTNCQPRPFGRN
jgi:hypothetical protein